MICALAHALIALISLLASASAKRRIDYGIAETQRTSGSRQKRTISAAYEQEVKHGNLDRRGLPSGALSFSEQDTSSRAR